MKLSPQISEKELILQRVVSSPVTLKIVIVNLSYSDEYWFITNQLSEWKKITSDPEMLPTVSGPL